MVQGRLELSARKNPLEVYRKSARVPPADSARKNPLEVSRKFARVTALTTLVPVKNLKGFYFSCSWLPFGSSDQHHIYKFSFPRTLKLTNKTWLKMAQLFF